MIPSDDGEGNDLVISEFTETAVILERIKRSLSSSSRADVDMTTGFLSLFVSTTISAEAPISKAWRSFVSKSHPPLCVSE